MGPICKIHFEVDELFSPIAATVVINATNVAGKELMQEILLHVHKKQSVELKPRVLRFVDSGKDFQSRFFIYGEKADLAQLDLEKAGEIEVIVAADPMDFKNLKSTHAVTRLQLADLEVVDYGISGTFVADRKFSEDHKCWLRMALRSGEFLDQIFLAVFE